MTITAEVIADSVSLTGVRLTTLELRYPKFVHGEFMTHRVFSRNASSSRAIPVAKMIAEVESDPALPVAWLSNRPGMQGGEPLDPENCDKALDAWLAARDDAVKRARELVEMNVHKQLVNRLIEPWVHVRVVVTSTDWENFFALRRHPDAQPEMHALANAIYDARAGSDPELLPLGQWHLPYVLDLEWALLSQDSMIKISVARCARVSYKTHDQRVPTTAEDLALYERLVGSTPLHASPAEHQATPDVCTPGRTWLHPHLHGNFRGWKQYRKLLANETVVEL